MCNLTGFGGLTGFGERPPPSYPATGKWEVRTWYHSDSETDHYVLVAPDGTTDMKSTFDRSFFGLAYDECDARNGWDVGP
jgi:hypothetical protein